MSIQALLHDGIWLVAHLGGLLIARVTITFRFFNAQSIRRLLPSSSFFWGVLASCEFQHGVCQPHEQILPQCEDSNF